MSEEDILKKKMMRRQQEALHHQLQQQLMQQAAHQQSVEQQLDILKTLMNEVLDPKARERLNNLKLVKPDLAVQIQVYIAQAYQAGQIRGKLKEQDLISILKLVSRKKETKIIRK